MRPTHWGYKLLMLAVPGFLLSTTLTQAAVVPAPKPAQVRSAEVGAPDLPLPIGRPEVKSGSVLVFDESNSSILYSRNADVALPIASITKLMTALVVLEADQPMDEIIEITADDRDKEKGSGSRLTVGTKLSRNDLLHLALMSSENRAAHAVGRNYPGGLRELLRAMNAKAKTLGMTRTHFVDPTGLSSGNVASPADLSKLVIATSHHPTIREFSTNKHLTVRVGKRMLEFRNTNTLVSNPDWTITLQKTGFINEAGRCLVMHTIIEDRPIVIVLLNSFGKYTRVADARRIRRWMETRQLSAARTH